MPDTWSRITMSMELKGEELRQAMSLLLKKGFQLEQQAFEELSKLENPLGTVDRLLDGIERLELKPLFITSSMIESTSETVKTSTMSTETTLQEQPELEIKQGGGGRHWHPYSKDVESRVEVILDPSDVLKSSGSMESFLKYSRNRFSHLERILRLRMDVKGAVTVHEISDVPANSNIKVIGMVSGRRESQKAIVIEIEDPQDSISVLFPSSMKPEKFMQVQSVLLDQVICVIGNKTKDNLVIASDLIFPDIPEEEPTRAQEPVQAALLSDIHIGSTVFLDKLFGKFLSWLHGDVGNGMQRFLAGHVKYVVIAGDLVDGIGIYPSQEEELRVPDLYKQYQIAADFISKIPDHIEVIIIPGNHDATRQALPQPAILRKYAEPVYECRKVCMTGDPSWVKLHGVEFLLYHGRSLDDVVGSVPGIMYRNLTETVGSAMEYLLRSRHLAPTYGQKTPLAAEDRDWLVIDRVPDIFHAGHVHVEGCRRYKKRLIVNSGTFQGQTTFMKKMGLTPTPGVVPVVNLQSYEVNRIDFKIPM